MRGAARRPVILFTVPALLSLALFQSRGSERKQEVRQSAPATERSIPTLVGVGGCAAMACHGGTKSNERREYTTWIEHDRHSRAFLLLYEERALRMARKLGIERPERDARCLNCHSTGIDAPRGPKFSLEDGVSCEACHGAAERWLAPHSKPAWKSRPAQEKYGALGMINTKDVTVRASVCVRCHVGEPGREVTHELIAAGHPALVFELDAYTANMPPHWREAADAGAAFGARAWAAGQAVGLRQSLELLANRAKRADWPEFAEFECRSCHHELSDSNWRRQLGLGERRPGSPVWSNPHVLMVMRQAAAAGQSGGRDEFQSLRELLEETSAPARDIASSAEKAAMIAAQLVDRVTRERWDQDRLRSLLTDLAADPPAESLNYSTAAYTTMALGAVFESLARINAQSGADDPRWAARVRRALDVLYDDVQQPSSFDVMRFVSDLKSFRTML